MTEDQPKDGNDDLQPQDAQEFHPEVEAEPFEAAQDRGPTYDMPPPGSQGSGGAAQGSFGLAAICHLLGLTDMTVPILLIGVIAPLVMWLALKDTDPEVDFAGKESINFQINMLVWWIASFMLSVCVIGIPLLFALPIVELIFVILATIETAQGRRYRYPFIFRILV